ncbi:MAG: isoprenylcysteine carboxylmethyltransferase family protein [Bauldia sp.]|nr:isoprenylcysteine carboxylmethyltransferase family protein [Bauldia sp.]
MTNATPPSDNSGVRIFPPGVYLAGLAIGYAIWWFWPLPMVPGEWSFAIRVLGGVAVVAGIALMASALVMFRGVGTSPDPREPVTALALDGPYRFTRNPMYLGMALIQSGLALVGNALWPLLALVPAIWIIRTQVIDKEERYLEAKFGGEYRDFKARVHRWV